MKLEWCSTQKTSMHWRLLLVAVSLTVTSTSAASQNGYYGKFIGKLRTLHHSVGGDVYAVDSKTLHIRNFNYDGEGPDAFFYAGSSKNPSGTGFRIRDEKGTLKVLGAYRKKHITLTLPEGKTLNSIKWFSIWCREFSVNFGHVNIPRNLDFPKPQKIGALSGIHGVSSDNIVVVDAQTLLIPNFSYDGEAPDAKFWVGRGSKPDANGIRVPDENGKELPLRRYDKKTIVLTLPGDLTVFDVDYMSVWCEAFTVDFAHVKIPKSLNVPPSLRMLGVSPQSKLNCEVLWDELAFEVRWAVAGDSIVMQLVSKLEDGEYMAFGLSGDDSRSKMIGGDVVVAWVDKQTGKGYADDYFLDSKSQCAGTRGSCPDERLRESTDSVRLLNAALVNDYSIVTFQRPLRAQDELDRTVYTNASQPVIWAIGPLNSRQEVSYHSLANRADVIIDFGRSPEWNCPVPENDPLGGGVPSEDEEVEEPQHEALKSPTTTVAPARQRATPKPAPKADPWYIPPIPCYEPEDGVFYAQMGPTGGKRGYPAITGHVGWGISWYINGLLIPEINVVRGKTYTFVVEGGSDPNVPARYHPFYITDDAVGGYEYKSAEERANVRVFAGVRSDRQGNTFPTGTGRLCNWTPNPDYPADSFDSFGAYQRTLTLECDDGEAGIIQWTPDENTPDTVYYQCYTHRYLGWKIKVHDRCDQSLDYAGSEHVVSKTTPNRHHEDQAYDDEDIGDDRLVSRPSIQVATRVKPDIYGKEDQHTKTNQESNGFVGEIPPDSFVQGFPNLPSNTHQNFQSEPILTEIKAPNLQPQDRPTVIFTPVNVPENKEPEIQTVPPPSSSYTIDFTGQQVIPGQTLVPGQHIVLSVPQNSQFLQFNQLPYQFEQVQSVSTEEPKREVIVTSPKPEPQESTQPEPTKDNGAKVTEDSKREESAQKEEAAQETQNDSADNNQAPPEITVSNINVQGTNRPLLTSLKTIPREPLLPGQLIPNRFPTRFPDQFLLQRPISQVPYHLRRPASPIPFHHHHPFVLQRPEPSRLHPTFFRPPFAPQNLIYDRKKPFRAPINPHNPHLQVQGVVPHHHHHLTHRPNLIIAGSPIQQTQQRSQPLHQIAQSSAPPVSHPSFPPVTYQKPTAAALVSSAKPTLSTKLQTKQATNVVSVSVSTPPPTPRPPPTIQSKRDEGFNRVKLPLAINTGFDPTSVIVEGGFRPIKNSGNNGLQLAFEVEASEVRESVLPPQEALVAKKPSENLFEGQPPETLEPIFIPSPLDRNSQNSSQAASTVQKEPITVQLPVPVVPVIPQGVVLPNTQPANLNNINTIEPNKFHIGGKLAHTFPVFRPRPVIRRPMFHNTLPYRLQYRSLPYRYGATLTPHVHYQGNLPHENIAVAANERVDTIHILPDRSARSDNVPPIRKVSAPPGSVISYDGKPIDVSLTSSLRTRPSIPISNRRPSSIDVRKNPQFGPYRGEVPPPVPDYVPGNIPQLQPQRGPPRRQYNLQYPPLNPQLAHSQSTVVFRLVEAEDDEDEDEELTQQESQATKFYLLTKEKSQVKTDEVTDEEVEEPINTTTEPEAPTTTTVSPIGNASVESQTEKQEETVEEQTDKLTQDNTTEYSVLWAKVDGDDVKRADQETHSEDILKVVKREANPDHEPGHHSHDEGDHHNHDEPKSAGNGSPTSSVRISLILLSVISCLLSNS